MKPDIYTSDESFYEQCYSMAADNYAVDDIFPSMVRYNTALFMLADFWPKMYAKMKENKTDPVIFGLSDEDYELISKNFAQIRAYMIQQNQIIDEYKKYYESEDNSKK